MKLGFRGGSEAIKFDVRKKVQSTTKRIKVTPKRENGSKEGKRKQRSESRGKSMPFRLSVKYFTRRKDVGASGIGIQPVKKHQPQAGCRWMPLDAYAAPVDFSLQLA